LENFPQTGHPLLVKPTMSTVWAIFTCRYNIEPSPITPLEVFQNFHHLLENINSLHHKFLMSRTSPALSSINIWMYNIGLNHSDGIWKYMKYTNWRCTDIINLLWKLPNRGSYRKYGNVNWRKLQETNKPLRLREPSLSQTTQKKSNEMLSHSNST
jgi:hypothetical protein